MILFLAIMATGLAVCWSVIVLWANGMSDAPSAPTEGGGSAVALWLFAAAVWIWWFAS